MRSQKEARFQIFHNHNLGIIIDTGVVLDIMDKHPEKTLSSTMLSWIKDVVARTAPRCPRGKHATMLVSPDVYRDYRARVSGKAGTSYSSWHILRKSLFTKHISRQDRLVFAIQSLNTSGIDTSDWDGDRFDRPFFALLEAARQYRAWSDRKLIFASKDGDALNRIRDLTTLRDTDGRVHFADGLTACEELVMR